MQTLYQSSILYAVIGDNVLWEKTKQICSRHNSMTELCRTVFKYENKMDMG